MVLAASSVFLFGITDQWFDWQQWATAKKWKPSVPHQNVLFTLPNNPSDTYHF